MAILRDFPWAARFGLVAFLLLALAATTAPWLAPHDPTEIVGEFWQPPSGQFWLGTDQLGRDLFSRLLFGARNTFFIAGIATVLAFTAGVILGFIAAVLRGVTDQVLSRLNDMLMSIPTLIFALVVLSVLPITLTTLISVMALLGSTRVFRLARALALDVAACDFVEAARLRGEKTLWIVRHEILPNTLAPLYAEAGLRFAFAVLFLSSLSFLGLGIQPPETDWGSMVRENRDGIVYGIPAAFVPAGAIAVLTISINLVADAIINRTAGLRREGGR